MVSGDPADSLLVEVSAGSDAITHTIPLASGGWVHAWEDLSTFSGQTMTLRIGFQGAAGAREVRLDEVSIGATQVGVYPVHLPLISREVKARRNPRWASEKCQARDEALRQHSVADPILICRPQAPFAC